MKILVSAIACNPYGGSEALHGWIACRSPENIVVNLADVDDATLAGYPQGVKCPEAATPASAEKGD